MSVAVTTFGSTPVLKLLTAKGAEPEDRLMTPVAAKGDLEAIRYLLDFGVHAGDAQHLVGCRDRTMRGMCPVVGGAWRYRQRPGIQWRGRPERNGQASEPELSQFLLDHGASLESKDREGFTLLMQAVLSMEAPADRDRMVQWLLSKGVDPERH